MKFDHLPAGIIVLFYAYVAFLVWANVVAGLGQ